jgi:3-oxoacyl-[acyl-carrier-protein] synthase II
MNAPAGHASIELGFRGINTTVNHYAVSAESALAYGAQEIRRGAADVLLAGGADVLAPFYFESLTRFKALSPLQGGGSEGAHPFDLRRNGPVAGEGCGILCLEPLEAPGSGVRPSMRRSPGRGWPRHRSHDRLAGGPAGLCPGGPPGAPVRRCGPETWTRVFAAPAAAPAGPPGGEGLERCSDRGEGPLVTALKGSSGELHAPRVRAAALAWRSGTASCPPPWAWKSRSAPEFRDGTGRPGEDARGLLNGISHGGTYVPPVFQYRRRIMNIGEWIEKRAFTHPDRNS